MKQKIQDGDTVRLKWGGPLMTVSHVSGDYAACVWFEVNNQAQEKGFRRIEILREQPGSGNRLDRGPPHLSSTDLDGGRFGEHTGKNATMFGASSL
ncbi:DUF2158 domain-containing protein [Bradyrhizobium sp. WSM471]|uniref:DUF2158 domain-containing protein n=1 Tax=Bradyrhizobium sp. WSM471 TaxID=319017 RepID=UPI00024D21C1|nr:MULTISPECIES: DUF2158 domain-containing protein [Bradyrhizobium]EHR01336.1 uncharacterized small protein [Bradyrhizobium sp. WSM471]UFW43395.1 DUF2158 domain-containing protein [Bradyrhizobium canariense]